MNKARFLWITAFAAALTATLGAPLGASAQARNPVQRYIVNQRGDIALVGNVAVHCQRRSSDPADYCTAIQSTTGIGPAGIDNNYNMGPVDADSDASTSMSSGATLSLPSTANVTRAYLYWSCAAATTTGDARRTVRFRTPTDTGYTSVTATLFDTGMNVAGKPYYQGMLDVTERVQDGGNGAYWVADMTCTSGQTNLFGGWTLVIAYADETLPMRNLVVYDAYRNYTSTLMDVTISGFLTPATGTVSSRVGIVAWDGDRGSADTLRLISGSRDTLLGEAPGSSALNPNNDIGNSTITNFGAVVAGRFPAYGNTLGYDQDLFATTDALPNGATSATIRAQATGEEVGIGVLTFATDIFAPEMESTKTATLTDVDGDGTTNAGDLITYTITVHNDGQDALLNSVLTDPIPAGTEFVTGSLTVAGAAPAANLFSVTGGTLTVRLGTGANATTGGRIAPDASITVVFQVRITSTDGGLTISNQASVSGTGETITSQTFSASTDGNTTVDGTQPTIITTTDICGDNRTTGAESCDDGNTTGGDGCSAMCRLEVVIDGPPDGTALGMPAVAISGFGDPGATIEVSVGGMTLTTTVDPDMTWTVMTAALADGTYTATATSTDADGHTSTDTVTFTVDLTTRVAFLQPGEAGAIGDTMPELSGTGEPGASVEVTLDGTVIGTVVVDAEGNWTLQVPDALGEGEHTVSVTATDVFGNTATDTGTFEIDLTAPSLELRHPADGATTNDRTPTITGSSDPGQLITVIVDGAIVGTALTNADGSWSLDLTSPLADGEHTVFATTTDAAGNTVNDLHSFTEDTSAPDVAITSPSSGERIATHTPTITGTSEPGASVQVFVDGALVGTVTANADGDWTIPTTTALADGEHTVRAVATDDAGNSATSSGSFVVDTATYVAIENPADEGSVGSSTPFYSGTAEPGASVEVSVDGAVIGTVVAGADGRWFIRQPADQPLTEDVHTVTAVATDTVGNTATTSNDFDYDTSLLDSDGDGIPDSVECPTLATDPSMCADTDGDGIPDYLDPDDDGDGVPTAEECSSYPGCRDTDGDGTPDYLDTDDDGDGIPTRDERPGDRSIDTDGDGIPNYLDTDDDGDGIPTAEECSSYPSCRDTDSDGTPDYLDPDDDGDGILTARERADGAIFGNDVDGDGVPNWLDTDSDGDGRSDREEGLGDDDGDGIPNYLDPSGSSTSDGGMGDADGGIGNADGGVGDTDGGDVHPPVGGGFAGGACGCSVPGTGTGSGTLPLALSIFGLVAFSLRRRARKGNVQSSDANKDA